MRSNLQIITVSIITMTLVGCATPQHTNTLIFGTNTKLALDISQSPTNLASFTFGYKREEAVWMPLVANVDKDGKPCDVSTTKLNCLFQGSDGTSDKDTYSVLASFGAKFNGEVEGASLPKAKGGGGLAQFFATGIAARKLAESGGASLVSVQEANVQDAKARAEINKIPVTPENIRTEKSDIAARYKSADDSDKTKFDTAAKAAGFDDYEDFAGSDISNEQLKKFKDSLGYK